MNGAGTLRSLRPLLFSLLGVLGTLLLSGRLVGYEWDQALLLPIIRAGAEPGLYPPEDLIVTAGLQGPFHFYHLASFLYRATRHFEPWWFALYVLLLAATYLGYWRLARAVGGSDLVAGATVLTLSLMDAYLGTLHWSGVPSSGMVSSHAAMPFALFGLAWLLEGRYGPALAMIPVAFLLHPGLGAILAGCLLFALLLDRALPVRRRLGLGLLGLLGLLPNALFLTAQLGANWAPPAPGAGAAAGFWEIFEKFSYHALIGPHWREGYGWFFLLLAAAAWARPHLEEERRRRAEWVTLACLIALAGYAANLYSLRYPGLVLTFLFRVTMFLKPLFVAAFLAGLLVRAQQAGRDPRRWGPLALVLLLLVGALRPPVFGAEARLCLALGILLLTERDRWVAALGLALSSAGLVQLVLALTRGPAGLEPLAGWVTGVNVALALAAALVLLLRARAGAPEGDRPRAPDSWRALAALAMVALVLGAYPVRKTKARARVARQLASVLTLSAAPAELGALYGWFRERSRPGSLVLLPPDDGRFAPFRYATGRGVYAATVDINQLAYDLRFYAEGYRRLQRAGLVVRGPHDFDVSGYDRLSVQRLLELRAEAGVGYAVFEAARQGPELAALPAVFEGGGFRVIDVRQLGGKS